MADFHGGLSKKRHRIAVAWRVWDGGAMAVVAGWRKWRKWRKSSAFVRGRSWADPTQPYPIIHSIKSDPRTLIQNSPCVPPAPLRPPSPRRTQPPRQATPAVRTPSRRRPRHPLHEDEGWLRDEPRQGTSSGDERPSFCLAKKTKKTKKTSSRVSLHLFFLILFWAFCCLTPHFCVYSFFFSFCYLTPLFTVNSPFFFVFFCPPWHPPFSATPSAIFLWRIFGFSP